MSAVDVSNFLSPSEEAIGPFSVSPVCRFNREGIPEIVTSSSRARSNERWLAERKRERERERTANSERFVYARKETTGNFLGEATSLSLRRGYVESNEEKRDPSGPPSASVLVERYSKRIYRIVDVAPTRLCFEERKKRGIAASSPRKQSVHVRARCLSAAGTKDRRVIEHVSCHLATISHRKIEE
ncbi:uncharacterized protein LOC143145805 [Ptiloglossa arizonensis]|uniref:uncharacterized protein LOC143145805 n=1 Tax=Ptiloglossa arizonensis TaxID=3350558 RepID=UPI003FA05981